MEKKKMCAKRTQELAANKFGYGETIWSVKD